MVDSTKHCKEHTMKWLVIGIAGVTNGGKSSLSQQLHSKYTNSILLNQDDYFLDKDSDKHETISELNHRNWEIITSLNYEGFLEKISNILETEPVSKPGLLIIEGHLVLNYPPLVKLLDKKYFFTLTKEECWKRRNARVYDPPDVPGYFEKCVWPMYLKHKEEMEREIDVKEIIYIDGTRNKDTVYSEVQKNLENCINAYH